MHKSGTNLMLNSNKQMLKPGKVGNRYWKSDSAFCSRWKGKFVCLREECSFDRVFSQVMRRTNERGGSHSIRPVRGKLWKSLRYDQCVCLHVVKFSPEGSGVPHRLLPHIAENWPVCSISLLFLPAESFWQNT